MSRHVARKGKNTRANRGPDTERSQANDPKIPGKPPTTGSFGLRAQQRNGFT